MSGETTEIGRYVAWLARERGLDVRDATRSCSAGRSTTWRGSGRRSGTSSRSRRTRRTARCWRPTRCPAPPGSRARGSTSPSTSSARDEDADTVAIVSHSQTRELERAHVRRVPRAGRACARGTPAARRRAGRPRRRLHAEHPRDGRRVRRDGEPRRGLGELRARARRAQRDRPPRAARADGPARGRRLRLPRPLDRPPRRGRDDPRRPAHAAHVVHVPYGEHELAGRAAVGRAAGRGRRRSSSCRWRSTTRSSCSSRPARRAGRRPSCTATAASCSSTSRRTRSAGISSPAAVCCGSRRPPG